MTTAQLSQLKQTAFRLSDEDLFLLDLLCNRYDLASRTAALRFVLRWWQAKVSG